MYRFNVLAKDIIQKTKSSDPSALRTKRACEQILQMTNKDAKNSDNANIAQILNFFSPSVIAITAFYLFVKDGSISSPLLSNSLDYVILNFFLASTLFFLGYNFIGLAEEE
jgi:hypothetical protein